MGKHKDRIVRMKAIMEEEKNTPDILHSGHMNCNQTLWRSRGKSYVVDSAIVKGAGQRVKTSDALNAKFGIH